MTTQFHACVRPVVALFCMGVWAALGVLPCSAASFMPLGEGFRPLSVSDDGSVVVGQALGLGSARWTRETGITDLPIDIDFFAGSHIMSADGTRIVGRVGEGMTLNAARQNEPR